FISFQPLFPLYSFISRIPFLIAAFYSSSIDHKSCLLLVFKSASFPVQASFHNCLLIIFRCIFAAEVSPSQLLFRVGFGLSNQRSSIEVTSLQHSTSFIVGLF
ncbi:hypothetical protein F2P56_019801, partial [Juglans regia]